MTFAPSLFGVCVCVCFQVWHQLLTHVWTRFDFIGSPDLRPSSCRIPNAAAWILPSTNDCYCSYSCYIWAHSYYSEYPWFRLKPIDLQVNIVYLGECNPVGSRRPCTADYWAGEWLNDGRRSRPGETSLWEKWHSPCNCLGSQCHHTVKLRTCIPHIFHPPPTSLHPPPSQHSKSFPQPTATSADF